MYKINDLPDFYEKFDLDIRKSNNGRWIDQKCTPDVIQVIASAIIEYCDLNETKEFYIGDIWNSKFAKEEIVDIFKKPNTNDKLSKNEYDKFFSQPIKMFANAKILKENKNGRRLLFTLKEKDILEAISLSERFALNFLVIYIEKVIYDSGLNKVFDNFFEKQDSTSFNKLKNEFTDFIIQNTAINKTLECRRIFTKVLNPLSYKKSLKGTIKGHISRDIITKDLLMYNRNNFRDIYINKPKSQTRAEYESIEKPNIAHFKFQSNQAKKIIKRFNEEFENGISQYSKNKQEKATQMHHIFSASEFPSISGYVENIIALSPNEHYLYAHKDNNTHYTDELPQKEFLIIKANDINKYSVLTDEKSIYSFENFGEVLSTGFNKEEIRLIKEDYFNNYMREINSFYELK
ncbi:hypothetical protein [Macrococcus epidermidis]|uniref:hypothetical protein n=1 Tax=Macrococcus epidermidis TaxID=1902580 RepID=UPI0020B70428|nr:hypothetical protein [Macrococcus epidermidis]UTH15635.1 hypothetical protein KFV12_09955 [Macrococcus epidermidis]